MQHQVHRPRHVHEVGDVAMHQMEPRIGSEVGDARVAAEDERRIRDDLAQVVEVE